MRLLYLSPWFPFPLDTGSRTRVYYLLKMLAERHRVTILSLEPQGWAPAQVEAISPFCERAQVIPRDPFRRDWLRTATRFFSISPIVADPYPEMLRLVSALHADQPFDVVVAGTVIMAPYALALSGVTRILEEHNSGSRWMYERYQTQTAPLQRFRCWLSWRKSMYYESRLFPRFNLVTMVSEEDATASRALLAEGNPPVTVLPNGVDCAKWRHGLAETHPDTLIFSGALTYQANYEAMDWFLAEVYPLIKEQRPTVRLRITGQSKGLNIANLALDETVTLTGFVEDIRTEIARAAISIVPIRSGGGTRLKILEAMALGTPVISTTKGAEGIDARHGEHLLLADDAETFTNSTLELLQNPGLRQHLAINARRLVEDHYDWQAIGARFADLVEATVKRVRRGV